MVLRNSVIKLSEITLRSNRRSVLAVLVILEHPAGKTWSSREWECIETNELDHLESETCIEMNELDQRHVADMDWDDFFDVDFDFNWLDY